MVEAQYSSGYQTHLKNYKKTDREGLHQRLNSRSGGDTKGNIYENEYTALIINENKEYIPLRLKRCFNKYNDKQKCQKEFDKEANQKLVYAIITGVVIIVIIGIAVRLISKKREIKEQLIEPFIKYKHTKSTVLAQQKHYEDCVAPGFTTYKSPDEDLPIIRAKTMGNDGLRPINSA